MAVNIRSVPLPALTIALSVSTITVPVTAQGVVRRQFPRSATGEVGQRQTREEAAPGIAPTGRIATRIINRIQSRIRSRVDRNSDPQPSATASFEAADEQIRNPR